VKRRIIVSIVGVTLVALLVLGIPLAVAVARLYESEEVLLLEREANEARSSVSAASVERGDRIRVGSDDPANRFVVSDSSGERLGGKGPKRADATVKQALDGDTADERIGSRIIVAVPINGDEEIIGALRASRSAHLVGRRTRDSWLVMASIALAAVIVAALLAWWQARRLTRPIDQLVDAAGRLGGGDFSVNPESSGIDELDQLGAAMNTTAHRLGALIGRERAFSTDASHQLRTPIAGLRVKVESALLASDIDARATLEEMLPPIDRLETTVDDLLHLARDTDVNRSPLDAGTLLTETEGHWRGLLAGHDRSLRIVVEKDLPSPVVAEPAIRQILDVLVSNAERHGRGAVTISARSSAPGAVVIQVTDEGRSTLDAQHIFDRRTDGSHGVGLALARTLAEAEGARLILERAGPEPVFSLVIPTEDQ
jgi:signal transduction histidine kinase